LIAGFGLEKEFFGVGAMTEQSDDGAEDGDDGDRNRDRDSQGVMFFVFFVFGQFDAFGHFWLRVLSGCGKRLGNYLMILGGA
jgi:hypothetical protein